MAEYPSLVLAKATAVRIRSVLRCPVATALAASRPAALRKGFAPAGPPSQTGYQTGRMFMSVREIKIQTDTL